MLAPLSRRACGLLLAALAAPVVMGALPTNTRIKAVLTPSNIVDTRYRDGNDGTAALGLKWAPIPSLAGIQGTPQTVNLRTLYLTEPGGASLATTCSPAIGGGWSTTTDGLSFTYSGAYSGLCRTSATVSGKTTLSLPYTLTAAAASSTDTTAPAQVFGATATATAAGIHLTWLPVSEPQVASQAASGLSGYNIYRDGSGTALATVTAPSGSTPVQLTGVELGGSTGGSVTQTGNSYSVVSNGDGVGGTTESGFFAYQQISGDFRLCADLHAISGGNASAQIALMARSSLVGSDPTAFVRVNPTSLRTRGRGSAGATTTAYGTNVTTVTVPVAECLVHSGSAWTTSYSTDYQTFTTIDASMNVVLPASVYAGIFVGTGASTTTTGDVRQFTLTNAPPLAYDDLVTDGATHSYLIKAKDVAGNIGTASVSASATAPAVADTTPPAAPSNLVGTGPTSSTVSWTWTLPTDASGIRGCVPSWATTSGGTYTDQPEQISTAFGLAGLSASTARWLKVKCVDNAANVGAFSSPVLATSAGAPGPDSTPPTVPSGNSATGLNTTDFTLSSSGSTDSGCGVSDYRLYASTSANGPFNLVATITTGSFPYTYHSAGPASTGYFFKLTARDCASPQNESAQSATFSGSTTAGAGGTLQANEPFNTLVDYPYNICGPPYKCGFAVDPPYSANWSTVSDKGCWRKVDTTPTGTTTGAVLFDFTPALAINPPTNTTPTGSNHCMINDLAAPRNLARGVPSWIGWEDYPEQGFIEDESPPAGTVQGGHNIVLQLHDAGGGDGLNPPINWDAGKGVGNPWKVIIGATGFRHVEFTSCGNVILGQWEGWVMRITVTSPTVPGDFQVWHRATRTSPWVQCVNDVGLNYYPNNTLGPYPNFGIYHGEGNRLPYSLAQGELKIWFDNWKRGLESTGVNFQTVAPP